ncbi:amidohydrolase family protein [bacterium]|nr:amidohydrolase family protein [bacterium]
MKAGNASPLAQEFMETGRCDSCPIIDLHGHYGPYFGGYLPDAVEEKMLRAMDRSGMTRIVCSAHDALFVEPDAGNARMQAAIDRHPDRLLGYWVINPNYPVAVARGPQDLERARRFVGFKFLPDYHTYPVTGPAYAPVLEYANDRGLPILVHTWGGSPFDSPQQLAEVAGKYPRVTLLMGHSGYGDWETAVGVARVCPNAYLELTAVYVAHDWAMQPAGSGTPLPFSPCLQVNGIIEYMVAQATSKKIFFGTDLPWYSPHYAAGSILFARISDAARHDILHRNAERLLGQVLSHQPQL